MSGSVIEVGDKMHVFTRRLFEGDLRRHFVGQVTAMSVELQEVTGYTFVFNKGANEYRRRPELRTRILSLGQADFVVNRIPGDVALESLVYQIMDGRLVITDGKGFAPDIYEFGHLA